MKLKKEDLLANIFKSMEGIFDIFRPSEDMAEFLNVQGKLEPPSLLYNFNNLAFLNLREFYLNARH